MGGERVGAGLCARPTKKAEDANTSSAFFLCIPRTPKPQIPRGAVRGVRAAGSNAVSVAVGVVAKVRAAAHAFCLSDVGSRGVYRGAFEVKGGAEPVAAPFPDVARDVVDAVVVGGV